MKFNGASKMGGSTDVFLPSFWITPIHFRDPASMMFQALLHDRMLLNALSCCLILEGQHRPEILKLIVVGGKKDSVSMATVVIQSYFFFPAVNQEKGKPSF